MDPADLEHLKRAVRQELEALGRDGLTHWPALPLAALQSQATPVARTAARGGSLLADDVPPPRRETSVPPPSRPASAARDAVPPRPSTFVESTVPRVTSSIATARLADFMPLDLPLDERVERLAALQKCVSGCVRCPELARTRTQTVFGVGNPQAKILFVGEAPGADEDRTGEPFVGRAGQLLNDIIKACRLKREEIYICNVLRCRPPGNRLPTPEEADNCREYLDGQIALVNPQYIVCWGSTAAKNLLASVDSIGKMRGKIFRYGLAKVVCTYHPSYLLRNPSAKKDVWEDMKFLFRDMGIELTNPRQA